MGYEDIYIHNIKIHKSESDFRPYIYSQKELEMIFNYLDNNQYANSKGLNNCVLPIFIRVVLGCGLRKNEAINLKNEDIDLDRRIIIINNGKGNVSRIVPISESLANACKVYKSKFPNNKEFFFCNYKGQKLSRHITEHFQEVLKKLNILRADGTPPRLHDLRFTFAVMALEKVDQYIKKELKIKFYYRFMDDSIVLVKTKKEAQKALSEIQKFLKEKLELELNKKTQIFKNKQGVNFCGYKINEYRLKIRDRGKRKLKKKIKKLKQQVKEGKLTSKEAKRYIAGHLGYIQIANVKNLKDKLFYIE